MPITITPFGPGTFVGPGLGFSLSSSHSDAITTPTTWTFEAYGDSDRTKLITQQNVSGGLPSSGVSSILLSRKNEQSSIGQAAVGEGDNTYITSRLIDHGGTIQDTGTATIPWSNRGLGIQAMLLALQAPQGLTTADHTLLQETHDNTDTGLSNWDTYTSVTLPSLNEVLSGITTAVSPVISGAAGLVPTTLGQIFSGKLLDQLTTVNLTGGETCDTVDELVSGGGLYGCVLNCTTVPDFYAFTAPGETWCPRDLAVLEITRGGAVLLRHGIHTRSHEVYPLPGIPAVTLELDLPIVPPDYRFKVWWGEGVCGELLLLELP